jgi:hypothetical protein
VDRSKLTISDFHNVPASGALATLKRATPDEVRTVRRLDFAAVQRLGTSDRGIGHGIADLATAEWLLKCAES